MSDPKVGSMMPGLTDEAIEAWAEEMILPGHSFPGAPAMQRATEAAAYVQQAKSLRDRFDVAYHLPAAPNEPWLTEPRVFGIDPEDDLCFGLKRDRDSKYGPKGSMYRVDGGYPHYRNKKFGINRASEASCALFTMGMSFGMWRRWMDELNCLDVSHLCVERKGCVHPGHLMVLHEDTNRRFGAVRGGL